jgi:uncharacterized protein (DUF2164 family)
MNKNITIDNKQLNQKCINEVISRIQDIDDPSAIGVVAAQEIIDITIENLGAEIYNKAIADANKLLQNKLADLDYEIEDLKR